MDTFSANTSKKAQGAGEDISAHPQKSAVGKQIFGNYFITVSKWNGQPNTLTNRCGSLWLVVTGERIEEGDTLGA